MNAQISNLTPISRVIRVDRTQRRVWVGGWRWHHGFTGLILAAIGGALMAHDWKDRPEWIHDITEG